MTLGHLEKLAIACTACPSTSMRQLVVLVSLRRSGIFRGALNEQWHLRAAKISISDDILGYARERRVLCSLGATNYYLGGPAYVATNPPAVRLRRSTRPAARRQKHCPIMDLTAQGPTLMYFRRIRIRCVHTVTKECRGQPGTQ